MDLVIFDCDGVLVDSEMLASRALAAYLTDLGRPTTDAECRAHFTGISLKSVAEKARTLWDLHLPDDFVGQLRKRDKAIFEAELQPVPGVREALQALTMGMCVASSGTLEKINHSLDITGLAPFFGDRLYSAQQVEHGKPAPDLFQLAHREMGAPELCRTAVIEDSPAGVQGARAAGMWVFGFVGGSHCGPDTAVALKKAGAHEVFDDMRNLASLLA